MRRTLVLWSLSYDVLSAHSPTAALPSAHDLFDAGDEKEGRSEEGARGHRTRCFFYIQYAEMLLSRVRGFWFTRK